MGFEVDERHGRQEFEPRGSNSGYAHARILIDNLPEEAKIAFEQDIITPTVSQILQLAGIQINDIDTPITTEDMIGPTNISELDKKSVAFYFSGHRHPVLEKARRLPTFVTYADFLQTAPLLGIDQRDATTNFKGLARNLFQDEAVKTYGIEPRFKSRGGFQRHILHRFAIRREMALSAMRGDYLVDLSGVRHTNVFNGYGRAIIAEIYNNTDSFDEERLLIELENIDDLTCDNSDEQLFVWDKEYTGADGIGHKLHKYNDVIGYVRTLLENIGARSEIEWDKELRISEDGFLLIVESICSMDKVHKDILKKGIACLAGVHTGLQSKDIQKAKSVAAAIRYSRRRGTTIVNNEEPIEAINLEDDGFDSEPAFDVKGNAVDPKDYEW